MAVPSFAWAFAIPVALFGGIMTASLGRQIAYEIAAVGDVTPRFDSCTQALLWLMQMIGFGAQFVLASVVYAIVLLVCLRLSPSQTKLVLSCAIGVAFVVGPARGVSAWEDWRINRLCL